MTGVMLTIRGADRKWQAELNPAGTIIGRSPACDVAINSPEVSRRHARIFWAPSGRWMIEDTSSSNGTFVNGKRIASCSLSPGDIVEIGPASLSLGQAPDYPVEAGIASQAPKIIIEDFGTEVFYDKPRLDECPTEPCPGRLEQVSRRLSELTDAAQLYPEVCRLLAQEPKSVAAVFRAPVKAGSAPETLACHFGSSLEDTMAEADGGHPSHLAFRVSHRLLEAVRTRGRALMSKSIFSCDTQITISLIDEHSPRALICAPLGSVDDAVDLLYVDVPIDERARPDAEEVFAFVQAVVREVQKIMA